METKLESRLRKCLDEQPLCLLSVEKTLPRVIRIIAQAYMITGHQQPDEKDLSLLGSKFLLDLQESYGFFTVSEVSFFCEMGAKGEYGEFFGINLRTLHSWLQSYRTSSLRAKVKQRKAAEALPPISKEYNELCGRRHMKSAFEQYRDEGRHIDFLFPAYVYPYFQKRKMIFDSKEEKQRAMEMAKEKVERKHRYSPYRNIDLSFEIKREAMAYLLKRHYDRWIRDGEINFMEGIE